MENEKFVTVLTATFGSELAVIRSRLESEGITCFAKDELSIQVNPMYSAAIGGVKLQVKESDLNQTLEILKETGYIEDNNVESSKESSCLNDNSHNKEQGNEKGTIICPFCGSEEVVKTRKAGWLFLITSFLLLPFVGVFSPFLQDKYYCFDCKQEFKLKRRKEKEAHNET